MPGLRRHFPCLLASIGGVSIVLATAADARAQPPAGGNAAASGMTFAEMMQAGGTIGWIIVGLSVALVALAVQHVVSLRRGTMIPEGLPDEVHGLVAQGQFRQAEQRCAERPSLLGRLLSAALGETPLGYAAMQKAMEDAAAVEAARLLRRVEYFTVIGTIAPMLGLLGTVWGMILAFMEFEQKTNPQVSELAPGIYKALVTTLQGLVVAIPALAAYAYFRNRVDERVAESSLMAEPVFGDFRHAQALRRRAERANRKKKLRRTATPARPASPPAATAPPPERERPR